MVKRSKKAAAMATTINPATAPRMMAVTLSTPSPWAEMPSPWAEMP